MSPVFSSHIVSDKVSAPMCQEIYMYLIPHPHQLHGKYYLYFKEEQTEAQGS